METKFQTSFIPKKPIVAQSAKVSGSINILVVIGVLSFILSLVAAGGVIAWEKILRDQQVTLQNDLEARKKQFNPELIDFLKRKNLKIETAKSLLNKHMAVSDIFGIISRLTIENVRFKTFDFAVPSTEKDEPKITMTGEGASFSAIAYQADVFGRDKVVKNPILSNLTLTNSGRVSFSFSGTISQSELMYAKSLDKVLQQAAEQEAIRKAQQEAAAAAQRQQQNAQQISNPPATQTPAPAQPDELTDLESTN